ncbi:MAG TPA: D-alanyl-D-alanine carboxypeptidase [Solirubrobacteraceae bacterium]|nr:D-alanyl-D-alanine carboxypeptidase [Solirubrobacteraceae bacterium]
MPIDPAFYGRCLRALLVALLALGFATATASAATLGAGALASRLTAQMHLAGSDSSAEAVDLSSGRVLFSSHAATPHPPASVEKLYTSWTTLVELGPSATLPTTVLGVGTRAANGTWNGTLYLHGGGDPALGPADLAVLAKQLASTDGITHVHGRILGDESLFDDDRGDPSTEGAFDPYLEGTLSALAYEGGERGTATGTHAPAAWAAHELEAALQHDHVSVSGGSGAGTAPITASILAAVESPSIASLLGLMLPPSNNFFAEMLLKQLGARVGGAGTSAAGAAVVRSILSSTLGLHPTLVDGSGLCGCDHTTALQIVDLLGDIASTPLGETLRSKMAVAGETGTVADRMRGTPARGHCELKTGTLTGASNLAGYCTAAGGHTIAFAVMNDDDSLYTAHAVQDSIAESIARFSDGTPAGTTLQLPPGGQVPVLPAGIPVTIPGGTATAPGGAPTTTAPSTGASPSSPSPGTGGATAP